MVQCHGVGILGYVMAEGRLLQSFFFLVLVVVDDLNANKHGVVNQIIILQKFNILLYYFQKIPPIILANIYLEGVLEPA